MEEQTKSKLDIIITPIYLVGAVFMFLLSLWLTGWMIRFIMAIHDLVNDTLLEILAWF